MRVIQANCNRSKEATESILQLALEVKADMLFVQEPWIIDQRSINHSGFQQIAPRTTLRPRTTTWIRKDIQAKVVPGDKFQDDPDIQIFDVQEGREVTQFIHVYNERTRNANTPEIANNPNWALERILQPVTTSGHNSRLQKSVVLLGDLNLHHESWDPQQTHQHTRIATNTDPKHFKHDAFGRAHRVLLGAHALRYRHRALSRC